AVQSGDGVPHSRLRRLPPTGTAGGAAGAMRRPASAVAARESRLTCGNKVMQENGKWAECKKLGINDR
ncbi:MAG: hypothetical protein RR954_09140, partial [Christensenellaceae bacterium]